MRFDKICQFFKLSLHENKSLMTLDFYDFLQEQTKMCQYDMNALQIYQKRLNTIYTLYLNETLKALMIKSKGYNSINNLLVIKLMSCSNN